jgi:hypothetical protein
MHGPYNITQNLHYGIACYSEYLHYCCWVLQPVSLVSSRSAQLQKNYDLLKSPGLNSKISCRLNGAQITSYVMFNNGKAASRDFCDTLHTGTPT